LNENRIKTGKEGTEVRERKGNGREKRRMEKEKDERGY